MNNKLKKVVITGGAGFIGSNLIKKLIENETEKILIIDDLSTGKIENINDFLQDDKISLIDKRVEDCDDLNLLLDLNFTIGDLWMLAAAIGWALYSIYLFYWKSQLPIFQRFTLVAFFGAISLLPFYIIEEVAVQRTVFNSQFLIWVLFAAISPGIIAFTLYTQAQKSLGASLTGFTLYIFTIYAAIYGFIFFDEKLESFHYLGTVLVFIGVYLAKKNYETKT